MSTLDAIYHRRSVRNYLPQSIDRAVVRALLDAAVRAPTAMDEEPWLFAVIQDKNLLDRLSAIPDVRVRHADRHHRLWRGHVDSCGREC
jgi:nitroreductase